ncbi:MAG TPA: cytochrome c oxidase subunit II [Baekduia sp.]|nr:cytochrome c oxidase subunit II [Baekduia sp.]
MGSSSRYRLLGAAVLAALATALLFAGSASANLLTPESGGSQNADDIASLYKLVLYIAIVVFLIVEGTLIYSLVRYRRKRNPVAQQIRGNHRLELSWTIAATLIVVAISVVTFIKLGDIRNPPNSDAAALAVTSKGVQAGDVRRRLPPDGRSLNICVNGQQYIWRYTYAPDCKKATQNVGDSVFSYEEMVVPVGATVTLDINAQDVAHSWWIPELGGKFDAVPGSTNYTSFKIPADKVNTVFKGQCAELCGRNHANMTARVRALSVADFQRWFAQQKADIAAANQAAIAGRKQFQGDTQ